MWSLNQITIDLDESDDRYDPPCYLASISTPKGVLQLIGEFLWVGDTLHINGAHIQGLSANDLGIAGLNAIGRKLLVEADVAKIVIQGGARTTGLCDGRIPLTIRFPRGK